MDTSNTPPQNVIPSSALPGPRAPMIYQGIKIFQQPTGYTRDLRERYGTRFRLKIMPPYNLYVLSDPDDVKAMFLAPRDVLHTGRGSAALEKFTGQTGLAWLDEEEHLARRKTIMPSVRGGAFKRIEDSVAEMAERIVATWPRGELVSLYPHVHRFTIQVIREVVFGKHVPSVWDELFEVIWQMLGLNRRLASMIETHNMKPLSVKMLRAIKPLGLDTFFKQRDRADALLAQAVRERLDSGESGDDMLSVLLNITHEDGSPVSGVELRDEMMTMFLAGTETTTAGICWALEYLSREPAILQRVLDEMEEGTDDAYLTAVCHEVLRVRPPTPQIIPREVVKPIVIGGVRYVPGDWLWASGYLIHHDPALYPDPDVFRPERFLNVKPGAYTWIPFGGGHTRCLGDRIAILEMKAVLRQVLTTCELRRSDPRPEAAKSRTVTITTKHGTRLELRPKAGAVAEKAAS
ncbi:cytochrome P450 [Streptomyces sp. NPDC018031]|uniref:cytochrome P450 n=1 Tax=Streptomyces sp. NPDC018031 TaxID=3365033 RepID=UPI00378D1E11